MRFFLGISLCILFIVGLSCSASRPGNVGNGSLSSCPSTPNCVSSHSTDSVHFMEPIPFDGNANQAMVDLVRTVESMKRTRIISQSDTYLYAEFTTALWRFVDDVEFVLDPEKQLIHFRSASRVGKSDLGVNRNRILEIKKRFGARSST